MLIVNILWKSRLVILTAIFIHKIFDLVTTIHYERQTFSEEIQIYSSYDVIFTTSRPSDVSCAWACYMDGDCVSFFYNKGSSTCIGSKDPCEVSTGQEEGANPDTCACWTVGTSRARDCLDILSRNQSAQDGVYSITTGAGTKLDVYCVMSKRDGGWTVFLRRYNGEVPFNRTFLEYDEGFGDKAGEHWLGLRYIYEMTVTAPSDLHIYSFGGLFHGFETGEYEEWSNFSISPGPNYTLQIGSLITWTYGNLNNKEHFNISRGRVFSTVDRQRDPCFFDGNCSDGVEQGGFWYSCCSQLNPTGAYRHPPISANNVMFNKLISGKNALKEMTMMYRRTNIEEHNIFGKPVQ